jgi:hypothetical protein
MANVTKKWGAVATIFSTSVHYGGSNISSITNAASYTSVIDLVASGYFGTVINIAASAQDSTDDLNASILTDINNSFTNGVESPIFSQAFDGRTTEKQWEIVLTDVPYIRIGLMAGGSTSHYAVRVKHKPWYYESS